MSLLNRLKAVTVLIGLSTFGAGGALAGPYILAGTDADDHGFATATGNTNGWLFMQRAIENLGPAVTNGNRVVVSLGSDPGSQAGQAAASAFAFANLVSNGWSFVNVNGAAAINAFFASGGAVAAAGIIMLDSGSDNVGGGLTAQERTALTSNATALNNFLGAGGGLFSQANGYGFLSALVPSLVVIDESETGINLTAAGSAAFPGLTNSDLSAGPYHNGFGNTGSIPVLGISSVTGTPIILGAATGTITDPGNPGVPVPEPASLALFGIGLAGLLASRRRSGGPA